MALFLLTGAAGFIGSHLVERLLAGGHRVIGIDCFDSFYPRAVKERNIAGPRAHPHFELWEIDLRDNGALSAAIDRAGVRLDAIVHLAAKAGVRPSMADPVGYQEVNVAGTQNLLELARRLRVPQFVFGSSSSVYGISPNVPWREDDTVLRPISPYASNKVSAELMGHVYSHLHGIRFVALRFFTVYGPRQRPDLAIHKFARLIRAGQPVPFFGDGSTRRDYTFVSDIVDGIVAALGYTRSAYEVINLGHNEPVSLAELVRELESALGRRAILDRQPEQPGDVPQTWADLTKARELLGYQPRVPLRDGLRAFVDWLDREG
ncbi:MAG: GDP-mannose 4,6-dehydratase [Opitutaceae bacterium]|nr:GDP-mannose 4,6-dehydratase [Opitutaceae bacterium]